MSNQGKKKKSKFVDPMEKSKEQEEAELSALKADIADEKQKKENIEWSNQELEKSVRAMEQNVIQLESGNLEADDSQIKQKYDNQKQLNIQLAEQKRWLEHELEQVKLKIQNEKMNLVPDPFALDWDALSETEMKRLVGQLEKTRNDLRSDLREMEWRLDKEGREYHHYEDFCKLYRAEILNLNRMLDTLTKNGMLPSNLQLPLSMSAEDPANSTSASNSFPSTGAHTPGSPRKASSLSPPIERRMKKDYAGSPRKIRGSPTKSIDPKLGAPRRTAGVRNLPKIEKKNGSRSDKSSRSGGGKKSSQRTPPSTTTVEEEEPKPDLKPAPLAPLGSGRKNTTAANNDLDTVAEDGVEE